MSMRPQQINNSSSASGGIGFFGLLQVALIILKLIEAEWNPVQHWSWWTVFIPTYIAFAIFIVVMVVIVVALFVAERKKW